MIKNIPIIDTHFHIWDANKLQMPWLSLFGDKLRTVYTLHDYQDAIEEQNIVKSCYAEVDAAKKDQTKESDLAILLCKDPNNSVLAATIGCDLSNPGFKDYIEKYMNTGVVKSVRHNLYAADPKLCANKHFIENTQLLGNLNIMYDLVMPVEKMQYGVALVQQCPETTFVINHCGLLSPTADEATRKVWEKGITDYAAAKNTLCKISEQCALAPDFIWEPKDVTHIIRHPVESFGEDRIVYATNWPVCDITGSIERWLEALELVLQDCPETVWHKLLHENAEKFYKL